MLHSTEATGLNFRLHECIICFICAVGFIIPFLLGSCVCMDFEPAHLAAKTLLNIDMSPFNPSSFPYLLLIVWMIFHLSVMITVWIILGYAYIVFAFTTFSWLLPISAETSVASGTIIRTKLMGYQNAPSFVKLLRTEQILNVLTNNVFGSVLIASHHIMTVFMFSLFTFILIDLGDVLLNQFGVLLVIIMVLSTVIPVMVQYFECHFAGNVYDNVDRFLVYCRKLTKRSNVLYRVACSCKCMTLQSAYPFFRVRHQTFPELQNQQIQLVLTLLMSRNYWFKYACWAIWCTAKLSVLILVLSAVNLFSNISTFDFLCTNMYIPRLYVVAIKLCVIYAPWNTMIIFIHY